MTLASTSAAGRALRRANRGGFRAGSRAARRQVFPARPHRAAVSIGVGADAVDQRRHLGQRVGTRRIAA